MRRRFLLAALAVIALAGCSARPVGPGPDSPGPVGPGTDGGGTVVVLAAASLQEAFTELGAAFESAHPGTTVRLGFGGSADLAAQITQGAPADVFAAAAQANMDQVVAAGLASDPVVLARNRMGIATPPGNPAGIGSLADLARPGVKLALCQPQVPCGFGAAAVFGKAGIHPEPVTWESDVKSVLSKVELGEVDAGLVYVTDVRSAGDKVTGIPIPDTWNAAADYPIARLSAAPNPAGAAAFVDFVLSPTGRAALTRLGFEGP